MYTTGSTHDYDRETLASRKVDIVSFYHEINET